MTAAAKTIPMYPVNDEPVSLVNEAQIPGGFYLMARKIEESEIAHAAPVIREVWAWILRQCNHKEKDGIKRGQCVRRIADMQEGLHWFVGYRKMVYSKTQCEGALEFLRKKQMITTTKTTRGLVITVCKYDTYQNPKNYEDNSEGNKKTTRRQQPPATINKNDKNEKNNNVVAQAPTAPTAEEIEFTNLQKWIRENASRVAQMPEPLTFTQFQKIRVKHNKMVIAQILGEMHNWKKLNERTSAFLTFQTFAKRAAESTQNPPKQQQTFGAPPPKTLEELQRARQ